MRHPSPSRSSRSSRSSSPRNARVIRYAVVGLGHIAQTAVLPGIAHAKRNSAITTLISDDDTKLRELGKRYRVAHGYHYDQFEEALASGHFDAVYIALPNELHHSFAVRAARAGIHVLCEKPMAVTAHECSAIIEAARTHEVRLMIAYRLHFERANLRTIAESAAGKLGDLRFFSSIFSMQVTPGDIRTVPVERGGGAVYDLGIYCINAARYLFQAEPIEVMAVSAKNGDPRFEHIDEMTSATLRFPGDRLAVFLSSFGAASTSAYDLVGTSGSVHVDHAYDHDEEIRQTVTTDGKRQTRTYRVRDQFAAEMDYFSTCIMEGRDPEPSGAEGRADVCIIEALHESARRQRPIALSIPAAGITRPHPDQEIAYPPARQPAETVHATAPSQPD